MAEITQWQMPEEAMQELHNRKLTEEELQAALFNALNKIRVLESKVAQLSMNLQYQQRHG